MKRILITLALALTTLFAFAQNFPAGMRMEFIEVGQDDNEFSIFSYKDDDGTIGYYLSLGTNYNLLGIFTDDDSNFSLSHFDETCITLGSTPEEANKTLDILLALEDGELGTMAEFPCRMSMGAERLGGSSTAICYVTKRLLQSKRLVFHFTSGGRTAETDLTKSALKSLISGFRLGLKLHPNGY
jgi:hypothetical protein